LGPIPAHPLGIELPIIQAADRRVFFDAEMAAGRMGWSNAGGWLPSAVRENINAEHRNASHDRGCTVQNEKPARQRQTCSAKPPSPLGMSNRGRQRLGWQAWPAFSRYGANTFFFFRPNLNEDLTRVLLTDGMRR